MTTYKYKQGFTLIEALGSFLLVVVALGLGMTGYMHTLKNTNESDVQSELDIDVQMAMERLKLDLRLSSLDQIFYYPAGPGPYTAISFPMAEDSDGDGLFELDDSGALIWDKTVVYHIWPSSPHQLRITTFTDRDNSLTDAQRQEQLTEVVATGEGLSTYNGNNSSYRILFENLLDWTIRPKESIYDAYSSITEREKTSLGFALLADGLHTVQFKVAGKNAKASGYRIGVDQLSVSPSGAEREAEAQLVTAESGASTVPQYMASGSWKGNYQLNFPATAVGQSFTLSMNNDQWEETNFGAVGYLAEDTEVRFDETLSPMDFVVQLQGNDVTWEAAMQTDTPVGSSVTGDALKGLGIAVHINGSELLDNGNWMAYNGRKCRLTFQAAPSGRLQIERAFIGKTLSSETTSFVLDGSPVEALFSGDQESPVIENNGTVTTDWIDFEISRTNNYLVVYKIKDDSDTCQPMAWHNQRTTIPDCIVDGHGTNMIFGLKSITASYPENGTYISQVFDTRLDAPPYGDLSWNAVTPSGTALLTKVRTGDQPDLSDAGDWSSYAASSLNPRVISASYKRYVQFQALMTSSTDGLSTPKLKDFTIDWTGEMNLVNIGGSFTKGPEYGIVEVLVDGTPLQSALSVDLVIYKDIYSFNKTSKRISSSLLAEIRPRNTGK